jgi:hypothetical protein
MVHHASLDCRHPRTGIGKRGVIPWYVVNLNGMPIFTVFGFLNPYLSVLLGYAIFGHGLSSHLTIFALRFCTTFPLGRVVYVAIHMSDTPTIATQVKSPMISRAFIFPPNDDECDGENYRTQKHPAQQGTECFGYGHCIGGVGHR